MNDPLDDEDDSLVHMIVRAILRHFITGGGVGIAVMTHDQQVQIISIVATIISITLSAYDKIATKRRNDMTRSRVCRWGGTCPQFQPRPETEQPK